MDDFERELKQGFLEEAGSALADLEQSFLILESDPQNSSVLDKIFRLAHNLKGSSKAVGFDEMGAFTHEFESLLLKFKNRDLSVNASVVSLLLKCADHISKMVEGLRADFNATFPFDELLELISAAKAGALESSAERMEPNASTPAEEEFISADDISNLAAISAVQDLQVIPLVPDSDDFKDADLAEDLEANSNPSSAVIEDIVSFAEEEHVPAATEVSVLQNEAASAPVVSVTPTPAQAQAPSQPSASAPIAASSASAVDESIRVSVKKLERLMNYVGEMTILQAVLREQSLGDVPMVMKKTVHQLGKVGKEIQDISLGLRMVPIKPIFQKMQRIVRDTAKTLGKDIQLTLIGEEAELDKTVLELVNDPLVHLIRNSVDHGVESPEVRLAKGKFRTGQVQLKAKHESGKFLIEVKDDGGGIDPVKIRKLAIEKRLIKPDANLTDQECINLIFLPGFSTKEVVTDVSGRGVGMDVVKTNVEELGGEVFVESKLGEGSTFKVYLPLTMAIIDGMIVRCGSERFVIPLAHVHESMSPQADQIRSTAGAGDLLLLRAENLPIFRLASLFGRKSNSEIEKMIAIVVRTGPQPFAILVDDIIGQYQVVIKQLGPDLQHMKGVSGSTILGDGRPALIVEPVELVKRDLKNLPKEKELRKVA